MKVYGILSRPQQFARGRSRNIKRNTKLDRKSAKVAYQNFKQQQKTASERARHEKKQYKATPGPLDQ